MKQLAMLCSPGSRWLFPIKLLLDRQHFSAVSVLSICCWTKAEGTKCIWGSWDRINPCREFWRGSDLKDTWEEGQPCVQCPGLALRTLAVHPRHSAFCWLYGRMGSSALSWFSQENECLLIWPLITSSDSPHLLFVLGYFSPRVSPAAENARTAGCR